MFHQNSRKAYFCRLVTKCPVHGDHIVYIAGRGSLAEVLADHAVKTLNEAGYPTTWYKEVLDLDKAVEDVTDDMPF